MSWFVSHFIAFFLGALSVALYFIWHDFKIVDIDQESADLIIKQLKLFEED